MQPRRPRFGGRSDLGTCCTERVRGLFAVTALHPATAVTAAADMNPEPGHDRCRCPEMRLTHSRTQMVTFDEFLVN
jgi:hypothetical protein